MSDRSLATGHQVLCLDGGGMRGLSMILLLKELMMQVRIQSKLDFTPEPWQCFDFICGTSTGGIIAILVGRLGKTLKECDTIFRNLGTEIFLESKVTQQFKVAFKGSKHSSIGLKNVMREYVNGQKMHDGSAVPKGHVPAAVVAVAKTTKRACLFCTYGIRAEEESVSILDACCATSAATMFFDPTTINGVTYVDGGFVQNNPSRKALEELEGDESPFNKMTDAVKELGCLVSLGTGRPTHTYKRPGLTGYVKPKGIQSAEDAIGLLTAIATGCHDTHLELKARFVRENVVDKYFRFDVNRGLEATQLNEADATALEQIFSTTRSYIDENKADFIKCAKGINPRTRGNAVRVYFQSFDTDAEGLSPEELSAQYPVGFYGQGPSSWTGRIAQGFFQVSNTDVQTGPLINSLRYTMPKIDDHPIDLRDCIVGVSVQIQPPYIHNAGAGLIVRYRNVENDDATRGIVFVKEPGRCCSIFDYSGRSLTRKASYPIPLAPSLSEDPFDTLKIRASGDRVAFMINDKVIAEKEDNVRQGTCLVALIAFGVGIFRFDNLELWLTERDEKLKSI